MDKTRLYKLIALSITTALVALGVLIVFLSANAQQQQDTLEKPPKIRSDQLSIPEVLDRLDGFEFISMAIKDTALEKTLSGEGPFTFFAPFDDAFIKLPGSTIMLFQNDSSEMKNVLLYHIANARLISPDLEKLKIFPTLEGQDIQITNGQGGLKINDATIIFKDIEASNGIIHVVDTVLFPKN